MRKKNGFTLTELLVVIAMLAIVGTIIIVNTVSINKRAKDSEYDRMVEMIKNATKTYVSLYPDNFADLYSSKAFSYVSLNGVIKAGLLDEETINPYTKEKLDIDDPYTGFVKVYVDGDSYEMVYKYPLTGDDYNTQIWLQMTTINGTEDETNGFSPINVFDGITPNSKLATIDFGFSNESGNLINANDPNYDKDYVSLLDKYKKAYNITFEVPSSFTVCSDARAECTSQSWYTNMPAGASISDYYVPTKTGTFEIKYNWSYKVGDKTIYRTDTRLVRITSETDREKNRVATAAVTEAYEEPVADPNGIIFRRDNFGFKGDQPLDTGLELLREDENGKRHPFSILLQGKIDSSVLADNVRLIDFIDENNNGFFVSYFKNDYFFRLTKNDNNGKESEFIGKKDGPLKYTNNKRFRMLIYFDPNLVDGKLFYEYVSDIDDSSFINDKKLSSGNGGFENYIFFMRNTSHQSLAIGGRKDKTANLKGSLERIIVFNKADPNLIYKEF